MTAPMSLTLDYELSEDRILAVINAGGEEPFAYWLTRRMTLNLIDRANPYLDRMSPVAGQTPSDLRGDLAEMERQVALARTAGAVSRTPADVMARAAAAADLAIEITITKKAKGFVLQLRGRTGGQASVVWSRDHLRRIVDMLENLAARAGWRGGEAVAPNQTQETAKPVRH